MPVHIIDHPYAQHILTRLRDANTASLEFRKGLVRLGRIVGYEIARTFPKRVVKVRTPLGEAEGLVLEDLDKVVIVEVLRAAMPLVEGLLKAFPEAKIGVVAARRREEGGKIGVDVFYSRIPRVDGQVVILADPMLATGTTMAAAIGEVLKSGVPKRLITVSVISTPVGIERVLSSYPTAEVFTVAIDEVLNSDGFIVPGLGDAGDRAFGG
ncbi:uracil phosphoribosyltransferase [Thermoproteus tenax]|uniref:Uracil phosphoribosyltransferase n=1 Tax=Thermoproteus tenax (strain ATCC 35583 / DSM 2078 / JCM 9277 / NBRC 100435 / Kra 1) TaxID=768679 RepID=G4RPX8_THETK|nr:uracil phosphoribosyltransferase [Thermoproteus tenax]CCC81623.1 Uracil phosphoribosyltransferase [Thermoproteus tenax Kra 1]